MSVCMSAVSAGISEVLIKYTGNVWLQIYFSFKITFPVIRLPEHLNSTISIIEMDSEMCININKQK